MIKYLLNTEQSKKLHKLLMSSICSTEMIIDTKEMIYYMYYYKLPLNTLITREITTSEKVVLKDLMQGKVIINNDKDRLSYRLSASYIDIDKQEQFIELGFTDEKDLDNFIDFIQKLFKDF